jgi:hypothetical protein
MAAHFHLDLFISPCADSKQKEPLSGTGADFDAWYKNEFFAKGYCYIFAGSGPFFDRLQRNAHLTGIGPTCPPSGTTDK